MNCLYVPVFITLRIEPKEILQCEHICGMQKCRKTLIPLIEPAVPAAWSPLHQHVHLAVAVMRVKQFIHLFIYCYIAEQIGLNVPLNT